MVGDDPEARVVRPSGQRLHHRGPRCRIDDPGLRQLDPLLELHDGRDGVRPHDAVDTDRQIKPNQGRLQDHNDLAGRVRPQLAHWRLWQHDRARGLMMRLMLYGRREPGCRHGVPSAIIYARPSLALTSGVLAIWLTSSIRRGFRYVTQVGMSSCT